MDLEIVILNEISQTGKKNLYDIAYMWSLKYDINELTCKIKIDSQTRKQTR